MNRYTLPRRELLARTAALAIGGLLPAACAVAPLDRRSANTTGPLVLVELQGGNDGLNTIIPWSSPDYARLRPSLGIAQADVVRLDSKLGFNPSLAPLAPLFEAGELAVILGVGYPSPNRSHFRSIEIWDTASDADVYLAQGWVVRALEQMRADGRRLPAPEAVVLGRPYAGPLAGNGAVVVALDNPADFARRARLVRDVGDDMRSNPALEHIVRVQQDLRVAGNELSRRMQNLPAINDFPRTGIGSQLANAARLIASGIDIPVIKVSQGSYDTHAFQRGTHDRLLRELAEGLIAFRNTLRQIGRWDGTLVMTYSEFGRRASENAGQGTDHGTAAPMLLLGAGVRGGWHGSQPGLDNLDPQGDLKYTTDFRQVFAEVARVRWGLDPRNVVGGTQRRLGALV